MNNNIKLSLAAKAVDEVLSMFDGTAEETYLRLLGVDEHGELPEDIIVHYKYENLDYDALMETIDDFQQMFIEVHNKAVELCANNFEGNLEMISSEMMNFFPHEGIDYEVSFSREAINKLKIQ